MATRKMIPIKGDSLLAKRLDPGTVVRMSDGWRGRVFHDDGEYVTMIRDGDQVNPSFKGHRGFKRRSIKMGGVPMISRTQVIDMNTKTFIGRAITVMDRAALETEWDASIARYY